MMKVGVAEMIWNAVRHFRLLHRRGGSDYELQFSRSSSLRDMCYSSKCRYVLKLV